MCRGLGKEKHHSYFVGASETTKHRAPGLAGLVPGSNWLPSQRANWTIHNIKVVDTRGSLLEQLATPVAYVCSVSIHLQTPES